MCLFNNDMSAQINQSFCLAVPDAKRTRRSSNSVFSVIMLLAPPHSSIVSGEHAMLIVNSL